MKVRGFTLIEMVITMLVGSILVLGIAGFVELGSKGYAQSIDRQRVQTQAKFALEKMTREARYATPNIFVDYAGQDCIAFFPIIDSGFYAVSGSDINFIVGDVSASVSSLNDKRLIINPTEMLSPDQRLDVLDNSFDLVDMVKISGSSVSGATFSIPGKASELVGGSVANRLYITANNKRISYCVGGDRITRDVGFSDSPRPLTDASEMSVSGKVSYTPASVQHNGVVHIDLSFAQRGEVTSFRQDVQVLNVP
ncbi:prepilin-type N-terminal cleavage/methylation domain-containing protein [Vibrio sp. 404]|uniref:Prepilin-type N-terminal cleavage/methylation domain-containing protein n=1 Tax=Vibrio marinisediminis TaxID=2758441 RepID=A0A7W2FQ10_9VIBR|nr:prepilin-type N-terminal cleavage/methylation domain-containing protein [Vibrio marinisediminis]MBA5762110.1 prepilin-type N-terminal cleavage/methylation domain-containing protein [Vibrio marinisediminis]